MKKISRIEYCAGFEPLQSGMEQDEGSRILLPTMEPLLSDRRFLSCSRGLIVNMEHVDRLLEDGFLMDNDEKVPISRREYTQARRRYLEFSFQEL